MALLQSIHSPADVKKISFAQLEQLAVEIRNFMVTAVAATGGHLASSLGAVELTLALHRVLDLPRDQVVWDVGHQTYAHKILTGRRGRFSTLRQLNGLSGFPKREESPYDAFNTGHSSTSISAALGMARARDLAEGKNKIVAVIGDGSLSNGLAMEALNDAGHIKTDLLVILNDNRMSISTPVGGISNYLNQIITGRVYNRLKEQIEGLLGSIPAVGKSALGLTHYLEEIAKGLIVPGVLFEELGFRYIGPIDGHDVEQVVTTLERVLAFSGPVLLHVLTRKGKGFEYAERDPVSFHGTPKFNADTGERQSCAGVSFSQVFARQLLQLAHKDHKIVAVVAAMTAGTALEEFAEKLPERFFDVGIAESHAVTLAAGMAAGGLKPVVAIYSTFLQRAYDQILHDVCLQNLPVVFALDRAGLVGE
ncbi:1-deoxy-D-xylulose-5-phosphate synthase, partial [candidate division FCPU426 bacterium]|nr:1-deoxy-D-xylulose-5-phosphate synthase [candidate division FCPU426 bacterium]